MNVIPGSDLILTQVDSWVQVGRIDDAHETQSDHICNDYNIVIQVWAQSIAANGGIILLLILHKNKD